MPRNGSGVYSLPGGSTVTNGDTSDATDVNTPFADIVADLNAARPIIAGGTGATTALGARNALGVGVSFDDAAAILADTALTYTASQAGTVASGDLVEAIEGGFAYQVAASGASDQHLTTAGGVKLYVLPNADGGVNVDAFGALGDGSTDDSAVIQTAIDNFSKINFSAKTYGIGAPIQIPSRRIISGAGGNEGERNADTILQKIGTTAGSGSNVMRSGAVTDSYVKNAVLIFEHSDNVYHYASQLSDMTIQGVAGFTTEYGIYAPRISQFYVTNVSIINCQNGWVTNDGWLCTLDRVTVNCGSIYAGIAGETSASVSGFTGTTNGIWWQNDGSGSATGTSLTLKGCWVRKCSIGYHIDNLNYSEMLSCAADDIEVCAYDFETCLNMNLVGCGMEQVMCNPGLEFAGGKYTVTGFQGATGIYGVSASAVYSAKSTASITFSGCTFSDFDSINSALNIIVQDGSDIVEIETQLPTNGNSFVSYTTGATRTVLNGGVLSFIDGTGTQIPKTQSDAPGGQLFIKDKAIDTAGEDILTITPGATGDRDYAAGKIKMFYTDDSFANGVGYLEAGFVVYREVATYYQNISAGIDVVAGNTFTGGIALSIAEAAGVWTITATPAEGSCTANLIDVEYYEALAGDVTVEAS